MVTQDVLDSPVHTHNLREPHQLERSMARSIEAGLQAGVKGIVDGGNFEVEEGTVPDRPHPIKGLAAVIQ